MLEATSSFIKFVNVKSSLIDLEVLQQDDRGEPFEDAERLSEKTVFDGCDSLNMDIAA